MRDELFDRDYAAGREALNDGIDMALARLGRAIVTTLNAIHRIQWSAPWDDKAARR